MGDYVFDPDDPDISKLAVGKGVKRLAVCRADVDNLGKAFISGFEQDSDNEEERYRFVTLSRTATFSRLMSVFFRYYINLLLSQNRYRLNIVYSGGDDVFLIGNWSDVINVAVDLRNAFKKYCGGALTLSAGTGIFPEKFPVAMAARSTAELEDKAKAFVDPATGRAKDAVCFFSPEDVYTFSWDQWETDVRAKIKQLSELFNYQKSAQDANTVLRGKSMIYRILELLRGADDKINIARQQS